MKGTFLAGVLLIIVGAAALIYQGFGYTKRERVLDLGPIHADADTHHFVWVPPVLGIVILAGGVACLAMGARKGA
jgi:hypothetical protein